MELSPEITANFVSLFWIMAAAVVAALAASATRRVVPDVVWLLIFGMMIGEHGFALAAEDGGVALVKELGLGMLFLLAGMHIRHDSLTGKKGRWGFGLWGLSALAGFAVMLWLARGMDNAVVTAIALAIALTSTALGTILPILSDADEAHQPIGKAVIIHGAVGELAPIVSMSLLLSSRSTLTSALVLLLFVAIMIVGVVLPARTFARVPKLGKMIVDGTVTTSATTLRLIFFLLTGLLAVSALLKLDIVLGAFAAGIIVRGILPGQMLEPVESRLSIVGYSFLIPAFFVCSGMGIDWYTLIEEPVKILGMVGLILMLRGGPVFLAELTGKTEFGVEGKREKLRLALYVATGLPIIVAVMEVASRSGLVSDTTESILVLAGAITVLVFPAVAKMLGESSIESLDKSVARALKKAELVAEAQREAERKLEQKENPRRSRFRRREKAPSDRASKRGKKD